MLTVDWNDSSTQVLFNPRMPAEETRAVHARLDALKPLKAHLWLATSGSTAQVVGQLKWVALSKQAFLASARGVNQHLHAEAGDIWIHALPDFHVGGVGIFARAHLSRSSVVDGLVRDPADPRDSRRWDARAFYRIATESQATLSALVPAQVYDLVQAGLRSPESLRAVVIGGGALSESLYAEARALGWNLLPSYGLTECCSQVATAEPASLNLKPWPDFPELKVLSHVEIHVSADGRLRMRAESLLTGYALLTENGEDRWIDPKAEGWFQSEDRGGVQDGVLTLQGRSSDFIKIGGESVDLNRLERTFATLRTREKPDFDLTLIAVPDERLGHVIHGAVALAESSVQSVRAKAIFDSFNEAVLPFERVRKLHFLPRIPRSPLQKLLKAELLREILK